MAIDPNLQHRATLQTLVLVAALWCLAVIVAAATGWLATIAPPLIAALVATGIILPTLWYARSPGLRALARHAGQRPILLFHIWRIPAALLFFAYGAAGALPPLFWILAGSGDLIAGSLAAWQARQPPSRRGYWRFHLFGFADFIVAVGTGLAYTLAADPRMAAIAQLPLALIPLFGVGISGASHLVAFDMLRSDRPVRLAGAGAA